METAPKPPKSGNLNGERLTPRKLDNVAERIESISKKLNNMSTPSKEAQSAGNLQSRLNTTTTPEQHAKNSGQNLAINLFNNLMSVIELKITKKSVDQSAQFKSNEGASLATTTMGQSNQSVLSTPSIAKASSSNEKIMRTPTAIQIQLNNKTLSALK